MTHRDRLNALISNYTTLPPDDIREEVESNYFDDSITILADVVKYREDPLMVGKIMVARLMEDVKEAVHEAEFDDEHSDPDESAENRMLFNQEMAGYVNRGW